MNTYHQKLTREHSEVTLLLPWYVNESLNERDRARVDAHVADCARCRHDLQFEQQVRAGASAEAAVEYMPSPSLKSLNARLDALQGGESAAPAAAAIPPRDRRVTMRFGLLAASVLMAAIAVSVTADRWWRDYSPSRAPYVTVTAPRQAPEGEVVRAVFSPHIQLTELQSILDEAQLRIVAGPTEAGVYSLAATSNPMPVMSSLALLRRHTSVRFAEATGPLPEPRRPP